MPHPNFVSSLAMEAQAERELAAFLRAASELADQDNIRRAGDTWLQTMESIDCPDENHEKFFRRVTILAISQLLAKSDRRRAARSRDPTEGSIAWRFREGQLESTAVSARSQESINC